MPEIFEYAHTVAGDEIDVVGHASNVAYLTWMQTAAIEHSSAQGWPSERYLQSGLGWVVRSHRVEYLRPALPDDVVVVKTWVAAMQKASSVRRYEIRRRGDDALLATGETVWAYINYSTGMPVRIPLEVVQAFPVVDRPFHCQS